MPPIMWQKRQTTINIRRHRCTIKSNTGKSAETDSKCESPNFYKSDQTSLRKPLNQWDKAKCIILYIETKGGMYVLQNGASRTVHRALRPKMLFGQVLAACTDGSKFSG